MQPRQWWEESAPPGWNRVKVSENLGGRPCGYIPAYYSDIKSLIELFTYKKTWIRHSPSVTSAP